LLQGPIASRLIGLAFPILIVLAVQTLVSVAETFFVGFLGDDALAGVALVFPILMLMTMMSNGGIGGGVASAIARAIGSGRTRDAEALMGHSVVIAVAFGAVFTAAILSAGRLLVRSVVIYVSAIRGPYSGKVVGVAYAAGALTHVLLFVGYGLFKNGVIGSAGLLVFAAVIGFAPIILTAIASRFFKPESLRSVPVQ